MIMRLQHQRPDGEVDTYHLKPGRRYHIGRGSACEVRILDLKLSRKHCAVEFSDGAWQVIDLLSTNGCKLDGEQIIGTVPLVTGNAIEAGQTQLIVAEIVDSGAAPVSVRRAEDEDTTHSDGEQTRAATPVVQGTLAPSSDHGAEDAAEPAEPDHTETTRAPLEQDEMPEDDSRIEPAIDSSDFTPEPLAEALTKTASLIPHPGMPRTPVVTAARAPVAAPPAPVAPQRPVAPAAPAAPASTAPRRPGTTPVVRPTAVFRAEDQKSAPAARSAAPAPAAVTPIPARPMEDDYTGHGMPVIAEDQDAALTVTPVSRPASPPPRPLSVPVPAAASRPGAATPAAKPAPAPVTQPGTGEERAYFITVLGRKIGPLSKAAARELKARELKGGLTPADLANYPQP